MVAGIPANSGIQDLKNVFDELTNSLKSLMSTRSAMTALPTNYNPILEKITDILEKIGEDIEAFVKLDIRTEVKKGDQITAVYETVYEINGNITTTYPDPIDQTIWNRHNTIADSSIEERKKEVIAIVQIISELVKIPIP